MSIEFLITSLIVVLMPGTGIIYTSAIGLGKGFKASAAAAIRCTAGIIPAALASVVGLSALLHTSSLVFQAIRILGIVYLFYMAWRTLQKVGAMDAETDDSKQSFASIAVSGTLLNVLNPKLALFFLAFLPQFVMPESSDVTLHLLTLAATFMAMIFIVFAGYGALASLASLARDYVISRPSVMLLIRRSCAGVFGIVGQIIACKSRYVWPAAIRSAAGITQASRALTITQ